MANANKGEVEFEASGTVYKLSFSANALCEIEDALGMNVEVVIAELITAKNVKLGQLRILFWQGLRDHLPDITLDETKAILRTMKPADMGRLIGEAFVRSMPAAPEGEAANPQSPGGPDGTGPAS